MNTTLEHKSQTPNQRAQHHESQSAKTHPSRTIVHAKLEMTEPGDYDEQEANAMAEAVVSGGKISRKISGGGGSSGIAVSQQMESQLSQLQGGGRQMPEGLRNMMESGFGRDFSQVRLHTDSEAASMSSSIHAKAFTHGNDIYFNQGQFTPETSEGQRLVAHELTHVVQGGGKVGRMSDTEKKWRTHYDIKYYINDTEWIKNVLGPAEYDNFENNYKKPSVRVPVTVIFFTTKKLSKGAFEDSLNPIFSFFKNNKNENGKKVLMIQGQPNLYGHKLIDIAVSYGPIENVIVLGHGNPFSVGLDETYQMDFRDKKIYSNIAYAFNLSDEETKGLKHSVLFDECLVGSLLSAGFLDHAYTEINKKSKNRVFVRGNKSVTWDDSEYYRDDDGYLKFKNTVDETTTIDGKSTDDSNYYQSSHNNNNPDNPYAKTGKEVLGIILDNMIMANNTMIMTHNKEGHYKYCSEDLTQREFMDEIDPSRLDDAPFYISNHKITTRDIVRFIESKHCFVGPISDEHFLYLRDFLSFLYDRHQGYDQNIVYIDENEISSQLYLEFLYTNYKSLQNISF